MKWNLKPLIILAIGVTVFLCFVFFSEVLSIGGKLRNIHIGLEWTFYAVVLVFVILFFVKPVVNIIGKPHLNLKEFLAEDPHPKNLRRTARIILRGDAVDKKEKTEIKKAIKNNDKDVIAVLQSIVAQRAEGIDKDIWKYSRSVFVTTSISQFGKLDAFFLIVNNFQMLKLIFNRFPYRPSFIQMMRIYTRVVVLAFTALSVEDLADRSLLEEIFPRLHPIGGKTLTSLLQGVTYAFITYRIGLFAKEFFLMPNQVISKEKRDEIRKTAFKKTMEIARSIVTDIPVNIFKKLLSPFR